VEGKVNINVASLDQLAKVNGIGAAMAQRIIDYREANGPFSDIAQIQNVKGIGASVYEKMKDQIVAQ